jgi:hypothetical protein
MFLEGKLLTATTPCVPDTLSATGAVNPGQLHAFLASLKHNNVLLVDGDRKVLTRLAKAVAPQIVGLPEAHQKAIEALVLALPNLPTVVALPFVPLSSSDKDGRAMIALVARSVSSFGCDAVVTFPPVSAASVRADIESLVREVVDVNDNTLSACERQRVQFTELVALARRGREDVIRLIKCATRFSRTVTLYDRYLGTNMPGTAQSEDEHQRDLAANQRFARSVAFFLQQWREARGADSNHLKADVYTSVEAARFGDLSRAQHDEYCSGVRDWQRQVAALSGVLVEVHLKASHWKVPHDRYISTEQCTIATPGGLDVIDVARSPSQLDVVFSDFKNLQIVHGPDVPHELSRFEDAATAKDKLCHKLRFPPVTVT